MRARIAFMIKLYKKTITILIIISFICTNLYANSPTPIPVYDNSLGYVIEYVGNNKIFHIVNSEIDYYDGQSFEILDEEINVGNQNVTFANNNYINIASISECIMKNSDYERPYKGMLNIEQEKKLLSVMPHYDTIFYTSADLIKYDLESLKSIQGILKELLVKAYSSNIKFNEFIGFSTDVIRANFIELNYLINHYDVELHNKYINVSEIKRSKLENEIYKQKPKNLFWYINPDELYYDESGLLTVSPSEIRKRHYRNRVYDDVRLLKNSLRVIAVSPLINDLYYNVLVQGFSNSRYFALPAEIIKQIEKGDVIRLHKIKNPKKFVDLKSYSDEWKNEYKDFLFEEKKEKRYTGDYRNVTVEEQFKSVRDYEKYIEKEKPFNFKDIEYIFKSKSENGLDEAWVASLGFNSLHRREDVDDQYFLSFTPIYSLKVLKNARVHLHKNYVENEDNNYGYESGAYWFCGPMDMENLDSLGERKFSYYIYDHINNFDNDLVNDGQVEDETEWHYDTIGSYIHQFNVSNINTYFDIINSVDKYDKEKSLLSMSLQFYWIFANYISFDEKGFVTGIYGNK